MTSLTKEATAPLGRQAARRRALEELLRARAGLVAVLAARPSRRSSGSRSSSQGRAGRRQPTAPRSSPATTSARPPSCSTTASRSARPSCRPASTPTSPATPRWRGASSPPASWPSCRCSSAATRSRRPRDILHELSKHKHFGVRTVQAEDEIAAAGMALGAAFAGHLGVTTTSGPGVALKSETISLAVSLELPLLLIDIQRGGPSTGLPTKTEAADLNIAMFGRHGEAPLPIVAAYSPAHCFDAAIEAARIALKYRTPVILLSATATSPTAREPWRLPDVADAARHLRAVRHRARTTSTTTATTEFWPYLRDPETLARPWAIPGTPGLMHRVGGLEKEDGTGNINYTPGEPRADGATCGPPRSPASPTTSRRSRSSATPTPTCCVARLGLDVGGDRRRRAAHAPARAQGRVGPPHAPQPAAAEPRRAAASGTRR